MPKKRNAHQLEQAQGAWNAIMTYLRAAFSSHGFDVTLYSDDELSGAVRAEAESGAIASEGLLTRSMARLRRR